MSNDDIFLRAAKEDEEFLRQLGQLMLRWSDVEIALFKVLRHYAGVTWPVAHALFSGTRAKAAMDFIVAIADNTNMEKARRDDLEGVFSQIKAINTFRDFLVHHVDGSAKSFDDADPTTRYVTNRARTSRPSKAKIFLVGSAHIAAMAEDCIKCCFRLHPHMNAHTTTFGPDSEHGAGEEWKFTPPQPLQIRKVQ